MSKLIAFVLINSRCIRFCFSSLIQRELDEVKNTWNHHHISHSRQAVVPNGKPIILYNAPEVTGAAFIIVLFIVIVFRYFS